MSTPSIKYTPPYLITSWCPVYVKKSAVAVAHEFRLTNLIFLILILLVVHRINCNSWTKSESERTYNMKQTFDHFIYTYRTALV